MRANRAGLLEHVEEYMAQLGPKPGSEAVFLGECTVFDGFSQGELRRIVRAGKRVSLPENWPLIHERTPGDACYILLAGTVAIFSGREPVAELGPGELVGELAPATGRLRNATVSTLESAELLRIEGDALEDLLRELPMLRQAMHDTGGSSDES